MDRILYWAAPLWEVALVMGLVALVLARLLRLALARRSVPEALAGLDPGLAEAPLFFFEPVRGVQPLSTGGASWLEPGRLDENQERQLIACLLDAFEHGRAPKLADWPAAGSHLQTVVLGGGDGQPQGVLAAVVADTSIESQAVAEQDGVRGVRRDAPERAGTSDGSAARGSDWMALGDELRLHRQRPLVEVRRSATDAADKDAAEPNDPWTMSQLSHTEESLLRHFISHPGRVQAPGELFKVVWPGEPISRHGLHADQRDRLRRLVFQLRQRVEPEPASPRYLCTAHGVGYVFYAASNSV